MTTKKLKLAVLIDAFSRYVIGYALINDDSEIEHVLSKLADL